MSSCLICHAYFEEVHSWGTLFSLSEPDPICGNCSESFEKITGELCTICGRPFSALSDEYRKGDQCYDCARWENDSEWQGVLTKNRSIYLYNDFAKEVISLYKFRGDYVLSTVFKTHLQQTFKTHFNSSYMIIPIPLSEERLYERGFNQATALAQLLNLPIQEILSRTHLEKQSKKNRSERIESDNVFALKNFELVKGKEILLIDDIYTTGTTLRHAAKVLFKNGANTVSSLTLMRG